MDDERSKIARAREETKRQVRKKVGKAAINLLLPLLPGILIFLLFFGIFYMLLNPINSSDLFTKQNNQIETWDENEHTSNMGHGEFSWQVLWDSGLRCIGSPTGCTSDWIQLEVYEIPKKYCDEFASERRDFVHEYSVLDPYTAVAFSYHSSNYSMDVNFIYNEDETASEQGITEFYNSAKKNVEMITKDGEGLTKYVYYCTEEYGSNREQVRDNQYFFLCGDEGKYHSDCHCEEITDIVKPCECEGQANCACSGKVEYYKFQDFENLEPRSDQEIKEWMLQGSVQVPATPLKDALEGYGVPLREDGGELEDQLNDHADMVFDERDLYFEIFAGGAENYRLNRETITKLEFEEGMFDPFIAVSQLGTKYANYACGAASTASIINSILGYAKYDSDQIFSKFLGASHGCYINGDGTGGCWGFNIATIMANEEGIRHSGELGGHSAATYDMVNEALATGNALVLVRVGDGNSGTLTLQSTRGHFVVLYGTYGTNGVDGGYYVWNPWSNFGGRDWRTPQKIPADKVVNDAATLQIFWRD